MKPRVKICGITNVDDAKAIADAGADAIGLVFYPPSKRALNDLDLAANIAQAVGPFVNVLALFVNPTKEEVQRVLNKVAIDCIQFHGDEDEAFCTQFGHPYVKALRMKPEIDLDVAMAQYSRARGILLDTYVKGQPGGTGEAFQWDLIPKHLRSRIVLAGGLSPENIEQAVASVQPYAVDVSGGVESEAGRKNLAKVAAFINRAKSEF